MTWATGMRRTLVSGLAAVVVLGVLSLPTSAAEFSGTATTEANSLATGEVAAPTAAVAAVALNTLPLLTCRATMSWVPSITSEVTEYEVVRVQRDTTNILAGPWLVNGTSTVDSPLPIISDGYDWWVRATLGSWRSPWTTAVSTDPLLCII